MRGVSYVAKYVGPIHKYCDQCSEEPGQWVRYFEENESRSLEYKEYVGGRHEALCFLCWYPIRDTCKVVYWINKYGRQTFAPGANMAPGRKSRG